MTKAGISAPDVVPFESAGELREAHARLLDALDRLLEQSANAAAEIVALEKLTTEVRDFLERGARAGLYIEEVGERAACQVLLDYWISNMSRAGVKLPDVRLARFDASRLPDLKDKPCPYVGLAAFEERTYFFGREDDTQALVAQLAASPLVVVSGASGSGKSSLVMGGVLAALRSGATPRLRVMPPFVPGRSAVDALAATLLKFRGDASGRVAEEAARLREHPGHLVELLGGTAAEPVVLTVDQFEEVFTLSAEAERRALAACLVDLLERNAGHRVILTMREEFKTRIVELDVLGPYLARAEAWYAMRPMGYKELRAAVERPAELVNLQFQSGIVDDLVKKVLGQPTALPLLQFTLRALWNGRHRNRITWDVYRKLGDPLKALEASADAFFEALAEETQQEVKRILLELVRVDDLLEAYRQPVPRSRLVEAGKANTKGALQLLEQREFVRITPDARGADAFVEIAHESLVRNWPLFVSWIDEKRRQRRQRMALTQAAERWASHDRPREGLLTGWQLQEAKELPDLLPVEAAFVEASQLEIERDQREREAVLEQENERARKIAAEKATSAKRFRLLAAVLAVVAGVALFTSYEALKRNRLAEEARVAEQKARDGQMTLLKAIALDPLSQVDDRMDLALLLGVEQFRMAPDQPVMRSSLLSALTKNLELQAFWPGHSSSIASLAYSPSGKLLASGSFDGTVILRDTSDGLKLFPPLSRGSGAVYAVTFNEDGKVLASAGEDKTVLLWNVETGVPYGDPLEHDAVIYGVAIAKGGVLAAACADGTVRLWDIRNPERPEPMKTLVHAKAAREDSKRAVYRVAFSPKDPTLLASAGTGDEIVLWNIAKGVREGAPLPVNREVFSMAFSHDGKVIASGNNEGRIDLWDVEQRKWKGVPNTNHVRAVFGVAFSHDDRLLATVSGDRTIFIRDVEHLERAPRRLNGYAVPFRSAAFSPNDDLATGTDKETAANTIVVWSAKEYPPYRIGRTLQQRGKPTWVAFGRNQTLFSSSEDSLQLWNFQSDVADSQSTPKPSTVPAEQRGVRSMLVAPDGGVVLTIGADESVKLWKLDAGTATARAIVPADERRPIQAAAVSGDGRTLAVASSDGGNTGFRFFDLPGGAEKQVPLPAAFATPKDWSMCVALDLHGELLAWTEGNSAIKLWDLSPGVTERLRPPLNTFQVNDLVFSPDQSRRQLASAGNDSIIRLWTVGDGSPVNLEAHQGPVRSVAFSPDGKTLVSGSYDRTALLWDVEHGRRMTPPLRGHAEAVRSVSFDREGRSFATGGEDGIINIWDIQTDLMVSIACRIAGRNLSDEEWKRSLSGSPGITCPATLADEADDRMLVGDKAGAETLFRKALELIVNLAEPSTPNRICWLGAVDGFAAIVLPACEQAVAMAPARDKELYRDSRGLARALAGNTPGAVEDFTATLNHLRGLPNHRGFADEFLERRASWIAALKEGKNPFDEKLLRVLRVE